MINVWCIVCSFCIFISTAWTARAVLDECNGRASIVFAVPGGDGKPSRVFEDNLIDLMYHFNIDKNNIHIGMLLYGEETVKILSPGDFMTRTQVNTKATLLGKRQLYFPTLGRGNNLVKGLRVMVDMFSGLGPEVRKIGVVFTKGNINSTKEEGMDILGVATRLKESGVIMYNLGSDISWTVGSVFEFIGSDRCRLFSMGSFAASLSTAIPFLASGICSEVDPSQTVRQGNCYPKTYAKALPLRVVCPCRPTLILFPDPNNGAYYYQCVPTISRRYSECTESDRVVLKTNRKRYGISYEPVRMPCSDGTVFDKGVCNHINAVSRD